jgi:hypothetical protein
MSNVSVTEQSGALSSNDYTVPAGQAYVSFETDINCTICFQNQATFGISSLPLAAGHPQNRPIQARQSTEFLPIYPNNPCGSFSAVVSSPGAHTIIIT